MQLENSFTVPVGVDEAWETLLDLPTVAPCMPGATLTEVNGDEFKGTVKVKLGPINLTYRGEGRFLQKDVESRRVVIEANGRDSRGSGTAAATVTATLKPDGDSTQVDVVTDLKVTGRPAQFGRGVMADVSGKLLGQFADCLAGKLAGGETDAPAASSEPPVGAPSTEASAESSAQASVVAADGGRPTPSPSPGATPLAPRVSSPPVVGVAPVPTGSRDGEVEPIDLFEVAGVGAYARKVAPLAAAFLVGGLAVWLFDRLRRR